MKRRPKNIYERFMNFEEQAASIYMRMASRFCPENQELSSLWLDMGMQEKQHAGLLEFCIAEELFAANLPTDEEIRQADSLFSRLMRQAANSELTVNEAFQIAAELEASEVNTIYCNLTTPLHGSMYLLRRKIMTSMPDHVQRLLQEAQKFGVPEDILRQLKTSDEKCPTS
jgi:hypothetical protein